MVEARRAAYAVALDAAPAVGDAASRVSTNGLTSKSRSADHDSCGRSLRCHLFGLCILLRHIGFDEEMDGRGNDE